MLVLNKFLELTRTSEGGALEKDLAKTVVAGACVWSVCGGCVECVWSVRGGALEKDLATTVVAGVIFRGVLVVSSKSTSTRAAGSE